MAWIILSIAAVYAGAGVLFAVAFVALGVGRVDPVTRGAPLGFRLLIAPGAAVLWPVLLWRWRQTARSVRP
jgi:hypothetical protein